VTSWEPAVVVGVGPRLVGRSWTLIASDCSGLPWKPPFRLRAVSPYVGSGAGTLDSPRLFRCAATNAARDPCVIKGFITNGLVALKHSAKVHCEDGKNGYHLQVEVALVRASLRRRPELHGNASTGRSRIGRRWQASSGRSAENARLD